MDKIGRYEILAELGQGAMGIVYKAKDPRINRIVALKTIHPGTALSGSEEKEFFERFHREAQTAGNLSHPNIVTIFDADEDPEQKISFIAMEYIDGESLQELLDGDKIFTPEEAIHITVQIADGLGYAHQNGIIHRDIKPANVILTPDNRAKITDFGIARVESSSLTRTGQFLGTPYYMAPEQIAGGQIDGRSDIFSLAVVFYQLLTREKPFFGNNITTILYKIVNQEPLPPTRLNMGLSPGFDNVLAKALAKNPAMRYQTATQMMADLKNLLEKKMPVYADTGATMVTETMEAEATKREPVDLPTAAQSAVTSAVPPVVEPAKPATAKTGGHGLLIGVASALTVVVAFLFLYLFVFNRGPGEPDLDKTPQMVLADKLDSSSPLATEGQQPGEPGARASSPISEQGGTGKPTQGQEKNDGQNEGFIEPPPGTTPSSGNTTAPGEKSTREEQPVAKTEPPLEKPATKEHKPPAQSLTPSRASETATPPPSKVRETEAPAERRPEEVTTEAATKETGSKPNTGEEPAYSVEKTREAVKSPAAEFGIMDLVLRHRYQSGKLTIRAKGKEIYTGSFSGGGSGGGSWKEKLSSWASKAKGSTFQEFGIDVPVGRYPLEVSVSVPGKSLAPKTIPARFRADQERCLSVNCKFLLNRDEVQIKWGCENDDDDDDDEDEDEDDDDDNDDEDESEDDDDDNDDEDESEDDDDDNDDEDESEDDDDDDDDEDEDDDD